MINRTDSRIGAGAVCRPDAFRVVVYNAGHPERVAFPAAQCRHAFAFPVGATVLAFTARMVERSAGGPRPLAPGYYAVGVVVNGFAIPVPPPLTVIVVAGG